MIEPEYDVVVVVELWPRNRDWLICVVGKDGEGAGSVEGKTTDCVDIDAVLIENSLDRIADAPPDIIGGLFLAGASDILVGGRSSSELT